jgi:hypothetical protein
MDKGFSSNCVDLEEACKVLVKSRMVQAFLKKIVDGKDYPKALEMMKAGKLEGDLGATIHNLFLDTIVDDAIPIWSGFIHQDHDNYPVRVNEYHGVYWVWAVESDPIGYFLDANSATLFVKSNWDNVHEDGKDPDEDYGEIRCPFCNTTDTCDHLVLVIDQTFRQAEGGVLSEAFNTRWSKIVEKADDSDFAEHEPFDDLLQEVDSLSDAELTASHDSTPGMSSTYSYFYCSSKKKTMTALKKFSIKESQTKT